MGAIVIPYWFIVVCVAVASIFWCGYEIGKDTAQAHGSGLLAVFLVPVVFICFAMLLFAILVMM